jgi:hypothetical protein
MILNMLSIRSRKGLEAACVPLSNNRYEGFWNFGNFLEDAHLEDVE